MYTQTNVGLLCCVGSGCNVAVSLGGVCFVTILTFLKAASCTVLDTDTLFIEMHSEFH